MRVISGTARGRRLAAIAGRQIRPTTDRVREALFSILFSRTGTLAGHKVLDLFAGSGALGIEALSRGADHAWFVDSYRDAVGTVRENLERCGLVPGATIVSRDVWKALPGLAAAGPFDIIFADPPYGCEQVTKLLEGVDQHGLLSHEGLLCLETAAADQVPTRIGTLQRFDQRRYGSTMLHFYSKEQA